MKLYPQLFSRKEFVHNVSSETGFTSSVIVLLITLGLVIFVSGYVIVTQKFLNNVPEQNQPAAVSPSASVVSGVDTSNWKTYRSEKYGFEVRYPKDWKLSDFLNETDEPTLVVSDSSGSRFIFLPKGGLAYGLDPETEYRDTKITIAGYSALRGDYFIKQEDPFLSRIVFAPAIIQFPDFRIDVRWQKSDSENINIFFKQILPTFKFTR